ncbi:hypothetical protein VNI00_008512 [Paramarasmius palmivorus]|uniref:F-box domain-containing protein n=1 Tax=Paramarasmius palmivorus TaxID=297713 RepID=A0AAW0CTH5_9AGAR
MERSHPIVSTFPSNHVQLLNELQSLAANSDVDGISKFTKQIAVNIEELRAEAVRYEAAARAARQQSDTLQGVLNSYTNTTLPIFRLPDEILVVIAEMCAEVDTANHALSESAMPWVLMQTCRRWRTLALYSPSLWRIIRVNTGRDGYSHHWKALLKAWLRYSEPLPIRCQAIFGDRGKFGTNDAILHLLVSQTHRWHCVDFDFGTQVALYHWFTGMRLHMPHLQSLYLAVTIRGDSVAPRSTSEVFLSASKLREVMLFNGGPLGFMQTMILLPWSQLLELSWSPNAPYMFLDIAPHLSSLRYCYLELVSEEDDGNARQIVTLIQLRHLEVFGPFAGVLQVLDHLSLPSLERFEMNFEEMVSIATNEALSSFIALQKRSLCCPRFLSAPSSLFTAPSCLASAEDTANIHELTLQLGITNDNDQSFANLSSANGLFPNLRILHLLFEDISEVLLSQVADFIETRFQQESRAKCHLEQLSIETISGWANTRIPGDSPSFLRILRLREYGLELQGEVVKGTWCSTHRDIQWTAGYHTMDRRRWARFGYHDWLRVHF